MENRRKYRRIAVSFPVECNTLPKNDYFYTVSRDLSVGGVKILSDAYLPLGASFKVNINLIDQVINLKARVAWCNKERLSERYSTGLEFVEMNVVKEKVISTFLNSVFNA